MKKDYLYLLLLLTIGSWLISCEESEPPFYDANSNGAYFDYEKEKLDTLVNFADYVLQNPKEVIVKARIKLLGYIEDYDRTLILKASPLEDYPLADIECQEVVFKAGEFRKEVEIHIKRPQTQDIRYGANICVDEERSDIGAGAEGFENFTIYVEESFNTPENWDRGAGQFFGAFTAEKHILIVRVTKDEHYVDTKNPWGVYPNYQLQVIDSIRRHNQEHPDQLLDIAIPFISGGPVYPKPYYWTSLHDQYLGTYNSESFISLCQSIGVDTSNEAKVFKADEDNLKSLHIQAVKSMMEKFNSYFYWGQSFLNFRSTQIPMKKGIDYEVVTPVWWTTCPNMVPPYYGEYRESKYKFMIQTLLDKQGDQFFLPEMFPLYQDWNSPSGFSWDEEMGGEEKIREWHQLFYTEWEKNKDQYDFTFPKVK